MVLETLNKKYFPLIYIFIWFSLNLLILTSFPFVHTDEAWLSGLSRTMMAERSPAATEDFFDLYERNPHGLKTLFHTLQISFISLGGYSLASVRLLSLLAGAICLFLFHRLVFLRLSFKGKEYAALGAMIWLSMDVQFVYISHLARQEIFMVLILTGVLNILLTEGIRTPVRGIAAGAVLGLSAGVHPNGFIIAWPAGIYLLTEILRKRRKWSEGGAFLGSAAITASFFVLISFIFNPDFIADYRAYGAPLGVLDPPDMKLLKWPDFYVKLFMRIGGTYYTPPIQVQMILFPLLLSALLLKKRGMLGLCGFAGFNIGLLIVGKYSQPSIVFLFPFYYLLWAEAARWRPVRYAAPLLMAATLFVSLSEIGSEKEDFNHYTDELNRLIPPGSTALGSLYSEYAMSDGRFFDWRNLHYLKDKNISLESYMKERNIEYIILPEEIFFIYENRPYWNVIYGNVARWYLPLENFLKERCSLIGEFPSPGYGMRISAYRNDRPWYVRVYKVSISE